MTALVITAAEKPAKKKPIAPAKLLSSSVCMETVSSCPSTVMVGLSSLARAASKVSISTVAVTEPSSEAWARVEEKVTVPLEQEVVELWKLVLSTGHSQ